EVVVLTVAAPTAGMVVVLKPVEAHDLRDGRKAAGRGTGTARPLRLSGHPHQGAVVPVAGVVLVGGEDPLRDEHRPAARECAQAVEIVARDPAVGAVDVVVGRDYVDPRRHSTHRRRVVVNGETVAEYQCARIGVAHGGGDQAIVVLRDDCRPARDYANTIAPGAQTRGRVLRGQ